MIILCWLLCCNIIRTIVTVDIFFKALLLLLCYLLLLQLNRAMMEGSVVLLETGKLQPEATLLVKAGHFDVRRCQSLPGGSDKKRSALMSGALHNRALVELSCHSEKKDDAYKNIGDILNKLFLRQQPSPSLCYIAS